MRSTTFLSIVGVLFTIFQPTPAPPAIPVIVAGLAIPAASAAVKVGVDVAKNSKAKRADITEDPTAPYRAEAGPEIMFRNDGSADIYNLSPFYMNGVKMWLAAPEMGLETSYGWAEITGPAAIHVWGFPSSLKDWTLWNYQNVTAQMIADM